MMGWKEVQRSGMGDRYEPADVQCQLARYLVEESHHTCL